MTPRELGYRMPAEWSRHAATWLSWPRPDGISFPGRYNDVLPTIGEMVRALAPHEPVHINVGNDDIQRIARHTIRDLTNVHFHQIPSHEPWCRDHGPIFLKRDSETAIVDWQYNAWGGKYTPYDDDDAVPQRIGELLRLPLFQPGLVLEGGSIEVNGAGLLLTTEACLLNPNRNPQLNRSQLEQHLCNYLGVEKVLWLGRGIAGDDTDGHVDDLTRFVSEDTVVTVVEDNSQDINYWPLRDNLQRLRAMTDIARIVELPMPGIVEYNGQRLPASYANFYIANDIVLLPTYRHKVNDQHAEEILQSLFPNRQIMPIDSTNLIWGLGSFHCLSQQQPL